MHTAVQGGGAMHTTVQGGGVIPALLWNSKEGAARAPELKGRFSQSPGSHLIAAVGQQSSGCKPPGGGGTQKKKKKVGVFCTL